MKTSSTLLALTLTACAGTAHLNLNQVQIETIEIAASPDANMGYPVKVDIVFAQDRETLKELEGFTASGWFSVKNLEIDLGRWDEKAVWTEVEIKPGETKTIADFPEGYEKAIGLVVFANYKNPGLHRQVIVNNRKITLMLGSLELTSPQGKNYLLTSPPEPAQTTRQM